jgi:hypothetical protein
MKTQVAEKGNRLSRKPCKQTIVLVTGEAHGLSLISYAEDFCKNLGFTKTRRDRIIKNMINSESFTEIIHIFKKNFGEYADVYHNYSKI